MNVLVFAQLSVRVIVFNVPPKIPKMDAPMLTHVPKKELITTANFVRVHVPLNVPLQTYYVLVHGMRMVASKQIPVILKLKMQMESFVRMIQPRTIAQFIALKIRHYALATPTL